MKAPVVFILTLLVLCLPLRGQEPPPFDGRLGNCTTLDACLKALDAVAIGGGRVVPGMDEASLRLQQFGEAAKQALLLRAARRDDAQTNTADAMLMRWRDVSAADVPQLIAALQRRPGGWVANTLGRIGTPEALQALADDVRRLGRHNQSGAALQRQGARALPYILAILEDDKAEFGASEMLVEMPFAEIEAVIPAWTATALDGQKSQAARLGALRALAAAAERTPMTALRPLLVTPDAKIREAAFKALSLAHDSAVLADHLANCRKDIAAHEHDDPYTSSYDHYPDNCLDEIAAFRPAPTPEIIALARAFLQAPNGRDRSLGAAFAGYAGLTAMESELATALRDEDWRVAYAAARSLGWMKRSETANALRTLADTHWLPEVRQIARAAITVITGGAPLAPPLRSNPVRSWVSLEIDATVVPDLAPCKGGRWRYGDIAFTEPRRRLLRVPIAANGRLPAGEFRGRDNGEFGGGLEWTAQDAAPVKLRNVNVIALAPGGDGVLAAFGEVGVYQPYDASRDPGLESIVISNGPSGYGYVLSARRGPDGSWALAKVAQLPRSPDLLMPISRSLSAAWVGGRMVILSPERIVGLAQCAG